MQKPSCFIVLIEYVLQIIGGFATDSYYKLSDRRISTIAIVISIISLIISIIAILIK